MELKAKTMGRLCLLVTAGASLCASHLVAQPFPKDDPAGFLGEFKIVQPDGGVFRTPQEDWDGARERIATDPEWQQWLDRQEARVGAWMARHHDHSDWQAGKGHDFVSPVDGSPLVWTDEVPGVDVDFVMSESGDKVTVTPKIFEAWVDKFRKQHVAMVADAARLYRLTGDVAYGQWAQAQLNDYADNLDAWPVKSNKSRLGVMAFNDAVMLCDLAEAARLLKDDVSPETFQHWFDGLFLPQCEMLARSHKRLHNHTVWTTVAIAEVALLYDDEDLWELALDSGSGVGLIDQLNNGVTSDYIWFEQSVGYNDFVVMAWVPLLTYAGLLGQGERLAEEAAVIQNMMWFSSLIRFPDFKVPNPSDSVLEYHAPSGRIATSYRILPTYFGLNKVMQSRNWDTLLDPPSTITAENPPPTKFPLVVSRSMESSRFAQLVDGPWQVFFHYGQLTKTHYQQEALNWSAYYDGVKITRDPGTVQYGSPMYREYYRRAAAHNVPLVEGKGQSTWAPGQLDFFDATKPAVGATQPEFQPGVSASRELEIDGDALVDTTTVKVVDDEQPAVRLGLTLHLQGEVDLGANFEPVSNETFMAERPAPFSYWEDVRVATFTDHTQLQAHFGNNGLSLAFALNAPGVFKLYVGSTPDRPPLRRTSLYLELVEPAREARFVTTLYPADGQAPDIQAQAAGTPAETAQCILVRSGWQTANIGDIAHTSGILTLLQEQIPDAEIILWGVDLRNGVEEMLKGYFPNVRFVAGRLDEDGRPTTPELLQAFADADLFLHSSSPGVHASNNFDGWRRYTGKPYGYYGITLDHSSMYAQFVSRDELKDLDRSLLNDAAFVFYRETRSQQEADEEQLTTVIEGFAPDAVFGVDQYDESWAQPWMAQHGLEKEGFICVIPRVRFAPYHEIMGMEPNALDRKKIAYNEQFTDTDMGKLREVITNWVRQTGKKVVLCPEMTFEVRLSKEEIYDQLPSDVRENVVWVDFYWMPDQAAAVYREAIALISMECHSPIIAAAAGTPSLYLTTTTETHKKQMWNDIGLGAWMFDLDKTDSDQLTTAIIDIYTAPDASDQKLENARQLVKERQRLSMETVRETIMKASGDDAPGSDRLRTSGQL